MPRPSTLAVETAIRHCRALDLRTEQGAAFDALLAAYRLRRLGVRPTVAGATDVVVEMFGLLPDRPDQGRCYLFRAAWGPLEGAGRSSVWNIATRQERMATKLFNEFVRPNGDHANDFRGGPRTDAAVILGGFLEIARIGVPVRVGVVVWCPSGGWSRRCVRGGVR